MEKWIEFVVDKNNENKSIRQFLEQFYVAHKKIYKLMIADGIKKNGMIAKLETIIEKDDKLEFDLSILKPNDVEKTKGSVDIIYEDEDLLVLNKPTGCLVYSDGNDKNTLTNYISYLKDAYYPILPVHRIDYDTSGLVLFAKHPLMLSYLSKQFEDQHIEKTYVCLVENEVKASSGIIEGYLARDRHDEKMRVSDDGQYAKTTYKVIERTARITKLQVQIEGGRKHQIRVHLRSIGNPVASDLLYGFTNLEYNRLMLHFENVKFIHPRTGKMLELTAKADF